MRGGISLENIILFWFIIFGLIYIFTKEEREEPEKKAGPQDEPTLEIPHRRDEIASLLKDGLGEEEKRTELKRFRHRCFNCESEKDLEFDHHLPLSKGYALKSRETGSNTVVLCRRCNREKGNKLPYEYYSRDKLRKLEELGIRSHLYYSSARIVEIEKLLIGRKIEKLQRAIERGERIRFSYYDQSKIMFLMEEVEEVPLKVYSRRRIEKYSSGWEWYLEVEGERFYNISWIYRLQGAQERRRSYNKVEHLKIKKGGKPG